MKRPLLPWLALLAALLLAGCGSDGPSLPPVDESRMAQPFLFRLVDADSRPPLPTFFEFEAKGTRIAYVLDFSGSMAGARVALLRKELERSFAELRPGMAVAVITFNDQFEVLQPPGAPAAEGLGTGWIQVPQGTKPLLAAVNAREPGNSTTWVPAMRAALELIPKPETIFFMTDGQLDNIEEESKVLAELNEADGQPAVINVIGIGPEAVALPLGALARFATPAAIQLPDPLHLRARIEPFEPGIVKQSAFFRVQDWPQPEVEQWWRSVPRSEHDAAGARQVATLLKIWGRMKKEWRPAPERPEARASDLVKLPMSGSPVEGEVVLSSLLEAAGFQTALALAEPAKTEPSGTFVLLSAPEAALLNKASLAVAGAAIWGLDDTIDPSRGSWYCVTLQADFPGLKPALTTFAQVYPATPVLGKTVTRWADAAPTPATP